MKTNKKVCLSACLLGVSLIFTGCFSSTESTTDTGTALPSWAENTEWDTKLPATSSSGMTGKAMWKFSDSNVKMVNEATMQEIETELSNSSSEFRDPDFSSITFEYDSYDISVTSASDSEFKFSATIEGESASCTVTKVNDTEATFLCDGEDPFEIIKISS